MQQTEITAYDRGYEAIIHTAENTKPNLTLLIALFQLHSRTSNMSLHCVSVYGSGCLHDCILTEEAILCQSIQRHEIILFVINPT